MNTTKLLTCARALALVAVSTCAAQAKPVTLASCTSTATECTGSINGNDIVEALGTRVGSNWHGMTISGLTQYTGGTTGTGSTNALFDVQKPSKDDSPGTLTFLQSISGPAVLTLKAGNHWTAYYLESGGKAGDWFEFDIPGAKGNGQPQASIYTAAAPTPQLQVLPPAITAVPEPSGIALVALALAGVAASTRRRRG